MRIIESKYADDALYQGIGLLLNHGKIQQSRAGRVLVMPCPVTTVTTHPLRRVLFSGLRDANPFFHLMEALWMLAGRNDAKWLDQFVGDFSERFAEPDGRMHAAYGYRWRNHFDIEGGGVDGRLPDQLDTLINLLRKNPDDRRTVLTMWDPVADLATDHKDIACNTHIYLRVRETGRMDGDHVDRELDLTVCCRSNDIVWGAYGSNLVHFSILQEYLAAMIGVGIGTLYQVSNNYHIYEGILDKLMHIKPEPNHYLGSHAVHTVPLVSNSHYFQNDLLWFFSDDWNTQFYHNRFFGEVAGPMRRSYAMWRNGERIAARQLLHTDMPHSDWSAACWDWYSRKLHTHLETD